MKGGFGEGCYIRYRYSSTLFFFFLYDRQLNYACLILIILLCYTLMVSLRVCSREIYSAAWVGSRTVVFCFDRFRAESLEKGGGLRLDIHEVPSGAPLSFFNSRRFHQPTTFIAHFLLLY